MLELRNALTAVRLPAGRWNVTDGLAKPSEVAAALAASLGVPPNPNGRLPGPGWSRRSEPVVVSYLDGLLRP